MSKHFDTIIIGSGVGGSAVGAILASRGQHVGLFEKNDLIGGRCTSYILDEQGRPTDNAENGFIVDVGVHLFGIGEKGPLSEVCRIAGEPDKIKWVLARNPKVSMHFKGKTQPFSKNMMAGNVNPDQINNLGKMFMTLIQMQPDELNRLWYTPLMDWVGQFTDDKNIHGMFAMLCGIYFCTTPDVTSTAEFITSFRELGQARSSGYPMGGCVAIPKAYVDIIKENGGEVHLNAPVEKILIKDNAAYGVIVNNETITADRVISGADIKATVTRLAGPEHFPADYVEKVNALTYTAHVVSLKVGLSKKITDEKMVMYAPNLSDEEIEELAQQYLEGGPMPMIAGGMLNSVTNFDPSLAPEGRQMIFFGTRCERNQDWKEWERICMDALREVFPDIDAYILWKRIDSPDLINKLAGEDGNVIGVGQTVDQIHERRPAHETPVKNLYLCSAEAGGHGIGTELAASSAIELAEALTGSE